MTKKEMVAEWVKNNPEPDQTLLPKVFLQWEGNARSMGGKYLNLYDVQTGKKKVIIGKEYEESNTYPHWSDDYLTLYRYPQSAGNMNCAYIKYIPEYDMIELSMVTIPATRPDKLKNVDKRKWSYVDTTVCYDFGRVKHNRLFLFRDNSVAYDETSYIAWESDAGRYYNHSVSHFITGVLGHTSTYNCTQNEQELKKFICHGTSNDNNRLSHPYYWGKWYQTMQPRKKSEAAKKIKKTLDSSSLREISDLAQLAPIILHKKPALAAAGITDTCQAKYAFLEKVNEDWVITCCSRNVTFDYYMRRSVFDTMYPNEIRTIDNKPFDDYPIRVVINKHGKPSIQTYDTSSKAYRTDTRTAAAIFGYGCTVDNYKLYEGDDWNSCPYLKFALSKLASNHNLCVMSTIISTLRYPVMRKLADAGYTNLVERVFGDRSTNKILTNEFGMLTNSAKASLNDIFGMTDAQLQYFNDHYACERDKWGGYSFKHDSINRVMNFVKHMEPKDGDIRSMDIKDFHFIVDTLENDCRSYNWARDHLLLTTHSYWNFECDNTLGQILKKTILLKRDNPKMYEIIKDCVGLLNNFSYDNRPPVENIFHYIGDTVESAAEFSYKLTYLKQEDELGHKVDWTTI